VSRLLQGIESLATRLGHGVQSFVQPGLRRQLAVSIAALTLLGTAVMFVVVYRATEVRLRDQIEHAVEQDAKYFAVALRRSGAKDPTQLAAVAETYLRERSFGEKSTLLIAEFRGPIVKTNEPELLALRSSSEGASALQQRESYRQSRALLTAPLGFTTVDTHAAGELRLDTVRIILPTATGTITAGQQLAPVGTAERGLARAFLIAGLIAVVGGLLAAAAIGARITRPVRRMATVAARVEGGDLEPRMRSEPGDGAEFKVLTESFNRMLDRLEEAFDQQRKFTADASHELRTPLTVIRGQLEVLAAQPDPSREEVLHTERTVQSEIARIGRLVDDLLLLAKSEQPEFLRPQQVDVREFVQDLWSATEFLADRDFELGEVPDGVLRADPDRLAQALRNLIANAVNHTNAPHGLVRLSIDSAARGVLRFTVDDDGPGIPPAERERVFERFHRVDTARDRASGGTGLGLAIVRAIAEGHGGTVRAAGSPEGGARFELELSGYVAAPAPRRVPVAR